MPAGAASGPLGAQHDAVWQHAVVAGLRPLEDASGLGERDAGRRKLFGHFRHARVFFTLRWIAPTCSRSCLPLVKPE